MRRLAFLLVLGCTGGQTGEITELTACERVTDEVRFASLDADVRLAFEDAAREATADLRWSDGTTTTLQVTLTRQDVEVERLGVASCAPSWRAPVVLALRTDDGRLDALLDGALVVHEGATSVVRAEAPVPTLTLDTSLDADVEGALLHLSAEHDALGWRGSLQLQTADDERALASF